MDFVLIKKSFHILKVYLYNVTKKSAMLRLKDEEDERRSVFLL